MLILEGVLALCKVPWQPAKKKPLDYFLDVR